MRLKIIFNIFNNILDVFFFLSPPLCNPCYVIAYNALRKNTLIPEKYKIISTEIYSKNKNTIRQT